MVVTTSAESCDEVRNVSSVSADNDAGDTSDEVVVGVVCEELGGITITKIVDCEDCATFTRGRYFNSGQGGGTFDTDQLSDHLERLGVGDRPEDLVEQDPAAHRLLQASIERLQARDAVHVHRADALAWLRAPLHGRFDIVFLDPPFAAGSPQLAAAETHVRASRLTRAADQPLVRPPLTVAGPARPARAGR